MVEQAKLKLDLVGKPVNHTDYRSMIGSLMYVTSNADHVGCHLDGKSTSANVQFLGDKLQTLSGVQWGLTPTYVNSAHTPSRGGRDSRVSHESTNDIGCLDKQPSRSGPTSDCKHIGVAIIAVIIVELSFGMKG
uniref:Uncharacterized protein n=1 Tax=Tanacetum cinerariifolium TaxID=118510 RepID=A0A6L2L0F7_TANCI|nr:hypothetical protein [Tanacetum cinerariifolium]